MAMGTRDLLGAVHPFLWLESENSSSLVYGIQASVFSSEDFLSSFLLVWFLKLLVWFLL